MTVFSLKILAMVSMVCDHMAWWLYLEGHIGSDVYVIMRSFGRMAFPVFCFLIANGYEHSSDKKRYLTRLIAFAAISQLPFTLVFTANNYSASMGAVSFTPPSAGFVLISLLLGFLWYRFVAADKSAGLAPLALLLGLSTLRLGEVYLLRPDMNVFYTLAFALAVICVLDSAAHSPGSRTFYGKAAALAVALLLIWDRADYGLDGMLLIVLLWCFRRSRLQQLGMLILWCALHYPPGIADTSYLICAALAAIPLYFYNGRLGKPMKTAFYLVYPLHLSVLGIIALL